VYDCFGAGQKVAQVTFGGRDWRQEPRSAGQLYDVFAVMRQLHELLWYLTEALQLQPTGPLHGELARMLDDTERRTHGRPDELLLLDVAARRHDVNALLLRTSELVRADAGPRGPDHRGADLMGAKLAGADLRGASLRGAYLIGADLRNADLRRADVIGADFRNADLRGADFTGALFLIQSQLDAANGDSGTTVPPGLVHPAHWS
jgi:uncharacterized protein YjbI with pentapeptide repeats